MTQPATDDEIIESIGPYNYGWHDSDEAGQKARRGLSEEVVRDISAKKNEPEWMLEHRLKALSLFEKKPLPTWGADLSEIDFDNIKYFVRSTEKQAESWEELPEDIKHTYDRLGIPEAENNASSPVLQPNTNPKSSTTKSGKTSNGKASSFSTPTPR